jgi:lipoprotein-anchoring transpeptidase ErfK/SrfK
MTITRPGMVTALLLAMLSAASAQVLDPIPGPPIPEPQTVEEQTLRPESPELESLPSEPAQPLTSNKAAMEHPIYGGAAVVRNPALIPPPESLTDFPIERTNASLIPARFRRQTVAYDGLEAPGTIVVDPTARFLYYVLEGGQAVRYGVGVGRAGFSWSGDATVQLKRKWPRWLPPEEMVFRDDRAKTWSNGMPGGPKNPLGARALYLYANGADTLYRIHGTNEPQSIGKAMSSGCIRMLNEDVAELFDRVQKGTPVVVLGSGPI